MRSTPPGRGVVLVDRALRAEDLRRPGDIWASVKAFGARIISGAPMCSEQFSSPAGGGWWSMGGRGAREATLVVLRGRRGRTARAIAGAEVLRTLTPATRDVHV